MSGSIFASLEKVTFVPAAARQQSRQNTATASTSTLTPAVTGQKRSAPDDFESGDSHRRRPNPSSSYDSSPFAGPVPSLPPLNFSGLNIMTVTRQFLSERDIDPQVAAEILKYVQQPQAVREMMLYTEILMARSRADLEKVAQIQNWAPRKGDPVTKNLQTYALVINLMPSIMVYSSRGTAPLLWRIVKKLGHQWGVPSEVFDNAAMHKSLDKVLKYQLTQARAALKKRIDTSVEPGKQQDVYLLAKSLVGAAGDNVKLTLAICHRAALWRATYDEMKLKKKNMEKFWDEVDIKLKWVYDKAKNDKEVALDILKAIFKNDCKVYGRPCQIDAKGKLIQKESDDIPSNVLMNVQRAFDDEMEKERGQNDNSGIDDDLDDNANIDPDLQSEVFSRPVTPGSTLGDDEEEPDKNDDGYIPGPNSELSDI